MSTYKGVAVVTQTMKYLLDRYARPAVDNTVVRIGQPEELSSGGGPIINIFLYDVSLTGYQRNLDLPVRDAEGGLVNQPTLSLELDYILSFTGTKDSIEPELLLGAAVRTLEEYPNISADIVSAALEGYTGGTPLSVDDLDYPIDIYPVNYVIEERSKLWSVFLQTPYKLSIEYRVRAVLVPGDLSVPPPPPKPKQVVAKPQVLKDGSTDG